MPDHPDPAGNRFGHALARAYATAAEGAGHEVRTIDTATIDFPLLRSQETWTGGPIPDAIRHAQTSIAWADHMVLFFPLWLGTMPALMKGFLEQTLRPGFAIGKAEGRFMWKKLLAGKSARVVVTMGMPAFVYRWFFRAQALKGLERNILRFCGIAPIAESVIGSVEGSAAHRERWLARMAAHGRAGR